MRRAILLPVLVLPVITGCDAAFGADEGATVSSPWVATATGRIDSADEARNLVAAVDGVISRVLVERGDHVSAGQIVLQVDCRPREAAAQASAAEADSAMLAARTVSSGTANDRLALLAEIDAGVARLANEDAQLRRTEAILERGFVARSTFDERVQSRAAAEAALRTSRARLADLDAGRRPAETNEAIAVAHAARSQARTARTLADQCAVRSPIDGTVLQIMRREGEYSGATQGETLMMVGDTSRMLVRAEVMEQDAAAVRIGQRAEVWIDGSSRRWSGRVSDVANVMGRRSARSLDPTDRFDRDVREVFVTLDSGNPPELVGLRVTVGLLP